MVRAAVADAAGPDTVRWLVACAEASISSLHAAKNRELWQGAMHPWILRPDERTEQLRRYMQLLQSQIILRCATARSVEPDLSICGKLARQRSALDSISLIEYAVPAGVMPVGAAQELQLEAISTKLFPATTLSVGYLLGPTCLFVRSVPNFCLR